MNANSRMLFNTCVMYIRAALTMGVTLLSSRWVLMALGEKDFGIYNLVAGLLSILSFLNITLASSTQRFLSYAQGKGNIEELNSVFNLSCILHGSIGILIFIIFEIIGSLFLEHVLQIPVGKEADAIFVLHCIAISMFISIVTVPYSASLITHENMLFVSCIQIGEALLKLLVAYTILDYSGNRIRLYALLMMVIPIFSSTCYITFCRKKYEETKINIKSGVKKSLFKTFGTYTGWNLIGGVSHLFKAQGIAMLLNSFMGVVVNAAFGIANQVNSQIQFFSSTIVTATRPQIVKSEGMGDRARMTRVSITTCKLTFLLLSFLVVPFVIECSYILNIWLKEVPKYTTEFVQLILIASLIRQLYTGVSIGIESVGSIKYLQIFVGGLHFLVLPLGYILLKLECGALSVFYMLICEEVLCLIITSTISHKVTKLHLPSFYTGTVIPCIFTFLATLLICAGCNLKLQHSIMSLALECCLSTALTVLFAFVFVFDKKEKSLTLSYMYKFRSIIKIKRL